MDIFKVVVVSTALIVNTVALPAYKSSYGLSAPPGVIYAQELRYGHAPTLGPSRAFNAEYVQAGPADLGYSQASRFGYAEGSTRHVYTNMHNYVEPSYEFKYDVNDAQTNDIKEQAERRVGDKVDGHYSVVEPDGTTRTVQYTADDRNGFNAVVTRHGDARHPVLNMRTHESSYHTHIAPISSYMKQYKYPISRPGSVLPRNSYTFAPAFSPDYAGSQSDVVSTPPPADSEAPGHDYGGSFTIYQHSKKRLRHGYAGYY